MAFYYSFNATFAHEPGTVIAADDWTDLVKTAKKYVVMTNVSWTEVKILNKQGKLLEHLEYIRDRYHHWRTIK